MVYATLERMFSLFKDFFPTKHNMRVKLNLYIIGPTKSSRAKTTRYFSPLLFLFRRKTIATLASSPSGFASLYSHFSCFLVSPSSSPLLVKSSDQCTITTHSVTADALKVRKFSNSTFLNAEFLDSNAKSCINLHHRERGTSITRLYFDDDDTEY